MRDYIIAVELGANELTPGGFKPFSLPLPLRPAQREMWNQSSAFGPCTQAGRPVFAALMMAFDLPASVSLLETGRQEAMSFGLW